MKLPKALVKSLAGGTARRIGRSLGSWLSFGSGGLGKTLKMLPPSQWKNWGPAFRDLTSTTSGKAKFAWRALAQADMASRVAKPAYDAAKTAVTNAADAYKLHVDIEAAKNEMAILMGKQQRGEELSLQDKALLAGVEERMNTFADDVGNRLQKTLDKQKERLNAYYDNAGKALTQYVKGKTQQGVNAVNGKKDDTLARLVALQNLIASNEEAAEKNGWRRAATDQAKIEVASKRVLPDILSWFDKGPGTDWTDYVRTPLKDVINFLPGTRLLYNTLNDAYVGALYGTKGWKVPMVPDAVIGGVNGFSRAVPLVGRHVPDVVRREGNVSTVADAAKSRRKALRIGRKAFGAGRLIAPHVRSGADQQNAEMLQNAQNQN